MTTTTCRKCRQPKADHCPECMVCNPEDAEHPYWCDRGEGDEDE